VEEEKEPNGEDEALGYQVGLALASAVPFKLVGRSS
jgi:hypothetical protein